jgi:hypothetical protein
MLPSQTAVGKLLLVCSLNGVTIVARDVLTKEAITEAFTPFRFSDVHYLVAH